MKKESFQCNPIIVLLILIFVLMGYFTGQMGARALNGTLSFNLSGKQAHLENGMLSLDEIQVDFGENDTTGSSQTVISDVTDSIQVDGLVSRLYRLEMDITCQKPITVSLDLNEIAPISEEDGEALMIGIGIQAPDDGSVLNKFIEPTIIDGTATASVIPAEIFDTTFIKGISPLGTVGKPVEEKLYLGVYWYSSYDKANGHFKVWFPGQIQSRETFFFNFSDREALLEDLESVYQNYIAKGYAYKNRTRWPMDVYIQSLEAEGYYSEGKIGTMGGLVYANTSDFGCIYLNSNLFRDGYRRQRVKEILAHEFFHFVQYNYANSSTGSDWLDESTATYFEWLEKGSFPDITIANWHLIYDGVFPEKDTRAHGYARMPLIAYLAQKHSEDFILNTYEMGGPSGDWVNALHVSLKEPSTAWVNDFYNQYFLGETTAYYVPKLFYDLLLSGSEEFTHAGSVLNLTVPEPDEINEALKNDEAPLLGSTQLSIPALGARVVALDVDIESLKNLPDDMDPVVNAEGNITLTVYAINGINYEKLGNGSNVKLKDFKDKLEDDVLFMALVVGMQESGRADVNISVQLQPSLMFETIKLAKEDTSDNIEAAYSAALMAIGDISLDEYGNFTATADNIKTQRDISSFKSLREPELTIEVNDFNITGTWSPDSQTGTGTVSCNFVTERITSDWDERNECEVTYFQTDTVTSTANFTMEMRGDQLFLLFTITYDNDIVARSESSEYGLTTTFKNTDVQEDLELEFLYTTP